MPVALGLFLMSTAALVGFLGGVAIAASTLARPKGERLVEGL